MNELIKNKTILLFDGYCNLCQASVKFILKHERNNYIYFTSLQSPIGIDIQNHYSINHKKIDSFIFIENNNAYIKSSAAIRVSKYLKGFYPFCLWLLIVPPFIRNWIYDYIAKNRYKWFGKKESCLVPDENLAKRFL